MYKQETSEKSSDFAHQQPKCTVCQNDAAGIVFGRSHGSFAGREFGSRLTLETVGLGSAHD